MKWLEFTEFLKKHKKAVMIAALVLILVITIGIGIYFIVKAVKEGKIEKIAEERSLKIEDSQTAALNEHNRLRALHGSPPLKMDTELNKIAIKCALHYERIGTIDHSCKWKVKNGEGVGENLYGGPGKFIGDDTKFALDATKRWYEEINQYNFNNQGFGFGTGHFTAMVWKEAKEFGIGVANNGNGIYVAAMYLPHPNVEGAFEENVPRPIAAAA